MAQVPGYVGAIATEPADRVEDGRREEGRLARRVQRPVPIRLAEAAVPTAGPEGLLVLGQEQPVIGIEYSLWSIASNVSCGRPTPVCNTRGGGEGGSLYHKVHKLSLGLVRGDKVLEAALDSRNSRYGARCSLEALDSGDVVFLLTAVKTAPGS